MRRLFVKDGIRYDIESGPDTLLNPQHFQWLWKYSEGNARIIGVKIPKNDGTQVIQSTNREYTDKEVAILYWELMLGNYDDGLPKNTC